MARIDAQDLDVIPDPFEVIMTRSGFYGRIATDFRRFVNFDLLGTAEQELAEIVRIEKEEQAKQLSGYTVLETLQDRPSRSKPPKPNKRALMWKPINAKNEPLRPFPTLWEVQQAARAVLDSCKKRYNVTVTLKGQVFTIVRSAGTAHLPPGFELHMTEKCIDTIKARKEYFNEISHADFMEISLSYRNRNNIEMADFGSLAVGSKLVIDGYTQSKVRYEFDKWYRTHPYGMVVSIFTNDAGQVLVIRTA